MDAAGHNEPKEIRLIKRKDLPNIKRNLNNISHTTKLSENDAIYAKVDKKRFKYDDESSNPEIYYKEQEKKTVELGIPEVNPPYSGDVDIKSKCELILALNSKIKIDNASKLYIMKHLDKIIFKINEGEVLFKSIDEMDINEDETEIKPKLSISSTFNEDIRSLLSSNSIEVIQLREGFHHSYS